MDQNVEVTKEDQLKINTFGKLINKKTLLESELEEKNEALKDIEDASR